MTIYRRPPTVYEETAEAEILTLIAEGVCNVYREFEGFSPLTKSQVKTTVANLKRKGLVIYMPHSRAWKATKAGLKAYDELYYTPPEPVFSKRDLKRQVEAEEIIASLAGMFDDCATTAAPDQTKTTKHCDKEWEFSA